MYMQWRFMSSKAIPLELLAFNRWHPQFKELIKVSHREWIVQNKSDFTIGLLPSLEMDQAEEWADRRLERIYQDRNLLEELIDFCEDEDDRDVFRSWLADLYHYEMSLRAAIPGGIEC